MVAVAVVVAVEVMFMAIKYSEENVRTLGKTFGIFGGVLTPPFSRT